MWNLISSHKMNLWWRCTYRLRTSNIDESQKFQTECKLHTQTGLLMTTIEQIHGSSLVYNKLYKLKVHAHFRWYPQCKVLISTPSPQVHLGWSDHVLVSLICISWLFYQGTPVSSTNKTHRHDIAEILLKVALIQMK
jgi:hypothetical protein